MDLIQAQISEIKRLNLIYIYTIDSAFRNGSNKYVGAKVVYDDKKTFNLDYRSEHFEELLLKLVSLYNEEKSDRSIILLGDLSKKLLSDDYFIALKKDKETGQESVTALSNKNSIIYKYKDLIFDNIYSILKFYKKYEFLSIEDISGFNNKWIITYKVGSVVKTLNAIITVDDKDNIHFRVSYLDGLIENINGSIVINRSTIESSWKSNSVDGYVDYNFNDGVITNSVYENDSIIYKDSRNTSLDNEDKKFIDEYSKIFEIEKFNFMKIGSSSYITFLVEEDKVSEDETIYKISKILLSKYGDKVFYEERTRNGISKYNDEVLVTLDEELKSKSLVKVDDYNGSYLLIEENNRKMGKDNYSYKCVVDNSVINIEEHINSISDTKKLVRKVRGEDGKI